MPYALWMTQRLLDQLKALPTEDASRIKAAFTAQGDAPLLAMDILRRQRQGL